MAEGALPRMDLGGRRTGAPVARPGKVVCIGLNYVDHADTGTPAGVAFGANDFPYLRAGDVVRAEIERLGRQRQRHTLGQA